MVLDRESLQVSWWRSTQLLWWVESRYHRTYWPPRGLRSPCLENHTVAERLFLFFFLFFSQYHPPMISQTDFPGSLAWAALSKQTMLCFSPRLLDSSFLSWWAWKLWGACQVTHPKVNVSMLLVEHYNISQYDMFTNLIIWPCLYFSSLSKWYEYLLHQLAIRILSPRWFKTRCKHKITCLAKWMQLVHHGHTDNTQVGLKPNLLFTVRLVS